MDDRRYYLHPDGRMTTLTKEQWEKLESRFPRSFRHNVWGFSKEELLKELDKSAFQPSSSSEPWRIEPETDAGEGRQNLAVDVARLVYNLCRTYDLENLEDTVIDGMYVDVRNLLADTSFRRDAKFRFEDAERRG